ncbi:MAG: DUF5995 family protein [Candidatus Sericytochromatia bacterium]|nr:DUF5995 family protein [Candidatus Sericytochromatia bacterium]
MPQGPMAPAGIPGLRSAGVAGTEGAWGFARPKDLEALTRTIERLESRYRGSEDARAIFATTYLLTTRNIIKAMDRGTFADRGRMERITLAFGGLWLDALEAEDGGRPGDVPPAWRLAFDAGRRDKVSPARVLMLSINAHVIRDLPFAVVAAARPDASLEPDFKALNKVLADEVPEVRRTLVARYRTWPEDVTDRLDDRLPGLAMGAARALSWRLAVQLAADPVAGARVVEDRAAQSGRLVDQPALLDAIWAWMRWTTRVG